jgi:hypothetical protein
METTRLIVVASVVPCWIFTTSLLGVTNEHRDIGNQQFQRFHSEDQSHESPTKEHRDFRSQQYRQFRNDDQRRKYLICF